MEEEIADVFITVVRSIAQRSTVGSILNRVHVLRNAIILRMDWRNSHCPIAVANHMLTLLMQENQLEQRRMMAVVCDLVFSSIIGHDAFFTHFISIEGPPHGPDI
jgi:hypothetical protein